MAYRRKQGITRAATFKEEVHNRRQKDDDDDDVAKADLSPPSLAAQAIRASAAHRDSSLSNAYGDSAFYRDSSYSSFDNPPVRSKGFNSHETTSMSNESNSGFWGVLARKAKAILDDDNGTGSSNTSGSTTFQMRDSGSQPSDSVRRLENPRFRKGLDAITTSLNQIGDTFEKAFEEGKTIMENKTADIIQETRKLQIRRKGGNSETQNQISGGHTTWQPLPPSQPSIQTAQETQLKASRDVAMATAAKAKLLLRELKTTKADLAFAKERCSQLEEENKMLRDSRAKSDNPADDDMIRLQLETLLAEKARLAHENSVYARENRFLREIVEYHQLTMQDVVYIDEGIEEVTEVYPIPAVSRMLSVSPPISPHSPPSASPSDSPPTLTNHASEIKPLPSGPLEKNSNISTQL